MAFFFSSIATQDSKRKKQKIEDDNYSDSDENEESLQSSAPPASYEAHSVVKKKNLRAVIWYWLALTKPNGVPANPLLVLRSLIECGVEADARQVSSLNQGK